MTVKASRSAEKDIDKLTETAREIVLGQINALRKAESLGSLGNVIKMKGKRNRLHIA